MQVSWNITVAYLRRPFWTVMFNLTTWSWSSRSRSSVWTFGISEGWEGKLEVKLWPFSSPGPLTSPEAGKCRRRCILLVLKELWEGAGYSLGRWHLQLPPRATFLSLFLRTGTALYISLLPHEAENHCNSSTVRNHRHGTASSTDISLSSKI